MSRSFTSARTAIANLCAGLAVQAECVSKENHGVNVFEPSRGLDTIEAKTRSAPLEDEYLLPLSRNVQASTSFRPENQDLSR